MNNTLDTIMGIIFLYLALTGVGIVDIALFRGLTADYITQLRRDERGALVRGLLPVLGALALALLLNAVAENNPPDSPVLEGMLLLRVLVLMMLALAFLLGYGATAWRLGERVLTAFGVAEPNPGWCVMVASLVILTVVWIPVLGWALGLYWIMLTVGVVIQRVMGGVAEPLDNSKAE